MREHNKFENAGVTVLPEPSGSTGVFTRDELEESRRFDPSLATARFQSCFPLSKKVPKKCP